ncbi:MAG: DUF4019 domain-containing protein [Novosphingobium sp.]
MSGGHQSLTEKEKQTLRLLVSGYDAKSMARHLGLSVHTVNERLRDARRKMATSSSREAARLLREVEGQDPEMLRDNTLGDAADGTARQQSDHRAGPDLLTGRPALMIGGLVMSIAAVLLTFSALSGGNQTAALAQTSVQPTEASTQAAVVEAARQWLALVDARDWQGSWNATGSSFRSHNTLQNWTNAAEQVHGRFGAARSRELLAVEEVPSAPSGAWMVKFKASYADKPQGTETLLLVREDGAWKVAGIYAD